MANCNATNTSIVNGLKLKVGDERFVDPKYKKFVWSLLYLTIARPDCVQC